MTTQTVLEKTNRRLGKSLLGLSVAAILGSALHSPAFAQTTYPLICRAGGEMKASIAMHTNRYTQTPLVIVSTTFTRSPRLYSPWTLLPGQCAWRDRGVSSSEPNKLNFYSRERVFLEFPAYGVGYVAATVSASTGSPAVSQIQNVMRLVKGRGLFTLSVRPQVSSYMVIEDIRSGD